MDEELKKEFQLPEIILGLTITVISDVADVFSLLIAPFPIVGQVALAGSKVSSFVVFVLIQGWLFFKGVNSPGQSTSKWMTKLIFSGGSTMDMTGVPFGQTMSLALVMFLGNHPRVAGVATTVAATALTGGAGAGAAAGGAARAGAVAEGAVARGGAAGVQAGGAAFEAKGAGLAAEGSPMAETAASRRAVSEEALGVRRGEMEQVMDIMQRMPEPEQRKEEDEEEEYRLAA